MAHRPPRQRQPLRPKSNPRSKQEKKRNVKDGAIAADVITRVAMNPAAKVAPTAHVMKVVTRRLRPHAAKRAVAVVDAVAVVNVPRQANVNGLRPTANQQRRKSMPMAATRTLHAPNQAKNALPAMRNVADAAAGVDAGAVNAPRTVNKPT